jgi:hypothetical protein
MRNNNGSVSMYRYFLSYIFIIAFLLMATCKNVLVYYPVPLTSEVVLDIEVVNGSYNKTLPLDLDIYFKDLDDQLQSDYGVSLDDVDRIKLEGAAYTILETDADIVVSGNVNLTYASQSDTLMGLEGVRLEEILDKPQADALYSEGIGLLNQALQEYLSFGGQSKYVDLNTNGSLSESTATNMKFTMKIEFTITTVIKKNHEVFDPLGYK